MARGVLHAVERPGVLAAAEAMFDCAAASLAVMLNCCLEDDAPEAVAVARLTFRLAVDWVIAAPLNSATRMSWRATPLSRPPVQSWCFTQ